MFLALCANYVVHVNNPKSTLSKTGICKQSRCLDLADFQAVEVAGQGFGTMLAALDV